MSPFLLLLPAAAVLAIGSWVSYHPGVKASRLFPWLMVGLYVANGWLWATAVRWSRDDQQTFAVSVAWDVITLAAYNLLPLVVCGVRLSPVAGAGVALVVIGACLVKWG